MKKLLGSYTSRERPLSADAEQRASGLDYVLHTSTRAHQQNVTWRIILYDYLFITELSTYYTPVPNICLY